jgi:urease alpha subunit
MPAEWEPHVACYMEWPTLTRKELWADRFDEAKRDYAAVANAIAAFEPVEGGIKGRIGSRRRFVAVEQTRSVRRDMLARNRAVPPIEVDPHDGTVTLDGRVLAVEPVRDVPLGRRYVFG